MADDPDPPRKVYQLKPKEFERVNTILPGAPGSPAATPADPGPQAPAREKIDVRELAKLAEGGAPLLGNNAPVNRANDVHAMLRANLKRANAAGLNDVPERPRGPSRRKRDYWVSLLGGNLAIVVTLLVCGFNIVSGLFAFGGMVFFSAGLTWIMWFVMDDY